MNYHSVSRSSDVEIFDCRAVRSRFHRLEKSCSGVREFSLVLSQVADRRDSQLPLDSYLSNARFALYQKLNLQCSARFALDALGGIEAVPYSNLNS